MDAERAWMARALALALRGRGRTSPNPIVGCVLVRDGVVIGEGWHQKAGGPHAEVAALASLAPMVDARGATAYVTLEPCNHHGRTGPCTEALIAAGVHRVVCAELDPNPLVAGRGVERLRAAGVEVDVGLYAAECHDANRAYLTWMVKRRPLVTLKAAISLDGRIATASGDSKWLSGEKSRRRAHQERNASDAIVVGAGTVRADDPALTTRLGDAAGELGERDAKRVIVDGNLTVPLGAKALPGALVFCRVDVDRERLSAVAARGAEVVPLPADATGRLDLGQVLDELGRRQILSVLVEGGGELHGQLLAEGLVDRVMLFVTPRILGATARPVFAWIGPERVDGAPRLRHVRQTIVDDDVLIEGDFFDDVD